MQEVKVGQRWRGKDGVVLEVENSSVGGLGVRPMDRRDVPLIRIMPDVFARHHTLVQNADGSVPSAPTHPEFQVGDVVRLKCGGPPMVVADTAELYNATLTEEEREADRKANGWMTYHRTPMKDGEVRITWHDAEGKMTGTIVSSALLVPAAVAVDLRPGEPVDWPLPTGLAGRPAP